jgi:hypothetical protein
MSEKVGQQNADEIGAGKRLRQLAREAAAHPATREVACTPDLVGTMKQKKAMYPKVGDNIVTLATQVCVRPAELKAKTAEMIDFCAYWRVLRSAQGRPQRSTSFSCTV